jgi:60 kDa SS-A/Ro ribonucleoprotein
MSVYSNHFNAPVPQSESARDDQVRNNAGGFVFAVDPFTRLRRFLVLGAEGGTYYVGERDLVLENAKCVQQCLKLDGARTVQEIVDVSVKGRAPKQSPGIFALALACKYADHDARKAALAAIPAVCRTGSALQEFTLCLKGMRSFGAGVRKAYASWYNGKPADRLAYQLAKYQQRKGVSHRDILRMARVAPCGPAHEAAFRWACGVPLTERVVSRKGIEQAATYPDVTEHLPKLLAAHEELKTAPGPNTVAQMIAEHGFSWEMVPTEFLSSPVVWDALAQKMPIGAMIRNLGRLTSVGLIKPMSEVTGLVCERLGDVKRLQGGRVHPLNVLVALNSYRTGKGRSGLTWTPERAIIDALDDAYYLSFGAVEPTGKRRIIALDVSGSMARPEIAKMPGITPRVGAAAMAMLTMRTEKNWHTVAFTCGSGGMPFNSGNRGWGGSDGITPLQLSAKQRLDDVVKTISGLDFGGTDVALPMRYATARKIEVDCFEIYTDNESWAGDVHPWVALEEYRQKMGIDARLVSVAMAATEYTVADPNDPRQLDVVGFDTSVPNVMSDFIKGDL